MIAREGYPFIGIALFLTVLGAFIHPFIAVFFAAGVLFTAYFFRNPKRRVPSDLNAVISPADGKIIVLDEMQEDRFLKERAKKISIFMSPLNAHINRVPVTGLVTDVAYNKGKFLTAFHEKASLANEQNAVVMKNAGGEKILFIQIAGWLARRIVCYLKPGESRTQGDIFGLIRFGSRMDVFVPVNYEIKVSMGEKVRAGETVLARKI
ncbi:MAG: phosphatidylserine decarboxylase family protein [Deltaproteobacteria bacterium]|nr:phosphatidylserine decarboxylase family protein [Deltaproteobacteria bacterium]